MIHLVSSDSIHPSDFLKRKFPDFLASHISDERLTKRILILVGFFALKFPKSVHALGVDIGAVFKHVCIGDPNFDAALWCLYHIVLAEPELVASSGVANVVGYLLESFDKAGYFTKRYIALFVALVCEKMPASASYSKGELEKMVEVLAQVAEMGTDNDRREVMKAVARAAESIRERGGADEELLQRLKEVADCVEESGLGEELGRVLEKR